MIRVRIVQPSLPHYRIPVFRALARREDLSVSLVHGTQADLPDADAPDLVVSKYRKRGLTVASTSIDWINAQFPPRSMHSGDVMLLEWNLNHASLVPAMIAAKRRSIGTVVWGHGYSLRESVPRRKVRDQVGRIADAVVVYDRYTAEDLVERGHPREKVFVAQNTIDTEPVKTAMRSWGRPGRLEEFQQAHGLADRHVILHVSRLGPHRHLEILLSAMPAIVKVVPNTTLVVIGDGEMERKRLLGVADVAGIRHAVHFEAGIYEEESLAPWFMSADVFCSPAHLGLAVFHAFAYGLPVVVGDRLNEHPPEARAVENGRNGVLFKHGDSTCLANAISQLLRDDVTRRSMGRRAIHDMQTRYSLDNMVAGLVQGIRSASCRVKGETQIGWFRWEPHP